MLTLKLTITALCALGLYASVFMFRKTLRAAELDEASVVHRPAARLLFGVPNAALGAVYYVLAGAGVWLMAGAFTYILLAAAAAAALMSFYLAYSLLFITRMPCPYCWTTHAINWLLALLLPALLKLT